MFILSITPILGLSYLLLYCYGINILEYIKSEYFIYGVTSIVSLLVIVNIISKGRESNRSYLIRNNSPKFQTINPRLKYDNEDIEKIRNIFIEVASKFKIKKINLIIVYDNSNSAFSIENSIGERSVVIYKGLLDKMTDNQLRRVIAHELSHLHYGHIKINIIIHSFFSSIENMIDFNLNIYTWITMRISLLKPIMIFYKLYFLFIDKIYTTLLYIFNIIQLIMFKSREYERDRKASKIISKDSMIDVLTFIIKNEREKTIFEKIYDTHPSPSKRIKRLNNL